MIRSKLRVIYLTLAAMLGVLGIGVSATDSPPAIAALGVAGQILDEGLHDKVERLLRTDVGLAGSRLHVRTSNAVVTVGGTVPDERSLRRALNLASRVPGVREIRNDMVINRPK
ncbi:BON domain-containing protein [Azonexus sp.]|uniref:BON domain-containing protein n=1 Tax=Azonexus sp. TaxID=1872668 RepID=UPI002831D317|nr:BON domain-containing protein [Azonexus sp.]MDR1996173.1 BON domain-containing protein [Azonexus sp.]